MSDKFSALPNIEPDPQLQVESWTNELMGHSERVYAMKKRRAFIQHLVMNAPIATSEEIREACRRRFGATPTQRIILRDIKAIGLVRVPNKHGGSRYRVASQLPDIDIEEEVNNRCRIDLLSVTRVDNIVYLEVNRGTAQAFVQLLNLVVDDAALVGVAGITSDMDKWIVIHTTDGNRARWIEDWMRNKIL